MSYFTRLSEGVETGPLMAELQNLAAFDRSSEFI